MSLSPPIALALYVEQSSLLTTGAGVSSMLYTVSTPTFMHACGCIRSNIKTSTNVHEATAKELS